MITTERLQPSIAQIVDGIAGLFDATVEVARQIGDAIGRAWPPFYEAAMNVACDDPKVWHIYTHTKKRRTRKKYRKKLAAMLAKALRQGGNT